jgi:hypothetical protein
VQDLSLNVVFYSYERLCAAPGGFYEKWRGEPIKAQNLVELVTRVKKKKKKKKVPGLTRRLEVGRRNAQHAGSFFKRRVLVI